MSSLFQFKQFAIDQSHCAMKVGTDGVLLGAWADLDAAKTLVDIGTGTGLIALMAAQRSPKLSVTALELDEQAASQALKNAAASSFSNRVEVVAGAVQRFESAKRFDSIICNPPFFKSSSTHAGTEERSQARQDHSLSLAELFTAAKRLGHEDSVLHLVWPFDRKTELLNQALEEDWCPRRITTVYPSAGHTPKRILVTLSQRIEALQEDKLIISGVERFDYTDAYIALTGAFYLNMPELSPK